MYVASVWEHMRSVHSSPSCLYGSRPVALMWLSCGSLWLGARAHGSGKLLDGEHPVAILVELGEGADDLPGLLLAQRLTLLPFRVPHEDPHESVRAQ